MRLTSVAIFCIVFMPPVLAVQPTVFKQPVQPFFSFNQSPIIQIHGLPAIDTARVLEEGRARYRLVHDLASNYTFKNTADENVLFDGETNRSTFVYSSGIAGDWEWGVQIPFVSHGAGSLDSFIEDWHDTFGLPQGGRDRSPICPGLDTKPIKTSGNAQVSYPSPRAVTAATAVICRPARCGESNGRPAGFARVHLLAYWSCRHVPRTASAFVTQDTPSWRSSARKRWRLRCPQPSRARGRSTRPPTASIWGQVHLPACLIRAHCHEFSGL